jgi:hypothetical protein
MKTARCFGLFVLTLFVSAGIARAQEGTTLALGEGGKLTVVAPKGWVKKAPASTIVQYEFAIPKAEGDAIDGRVTVMGAGGTIDANIDRWLAQFETADGKPLTKDKAKIEKTKIGSLEVHVVDLSGTFKDMTRPFGGTTTPRANYRMLGAIIVSPDHGNYFVKATGPKKTMDGQREAFNKMVESVKAK